MAKDSPADPGLLGRTIAGKFAIESYVGGGAMGAVYKAKQLALDKVVAIKVMHREIATDEKFVTRFKREAKAASRLDHPNSLRVIDFGEEPDGLLYLAMEFLDGQDLFAILKQDWPLADGRMIDILLQALAAIAVAHDQGIVHRDLKPENIMVLAGKDDEGNPRDIVKVCDFGIAKITERRVDQNPADSGRLSTKGLVVGTPEYMSPEQGRGESLDARSDLYSIGVILYQLLTRQVPFDAESAIGIVLKHVTEEPKRPSEVYQGANPRLEAICLKALQKKREDRYQSAREMRADLKAALGARDAMQSIPSFPRIPSMTDEVDGPMARAATLPVDLRDSGPTKLAPMSPTSSKSTPMATEALEDERPAGVPRRWTGYVMALLLVGGIGAGGFWIAKRANARAQRAVALAETGSPNTTKAAPTAQPPPVLTPAPVPAPTIAPTEVASTIASASPSASASASAPVAVVPSATASHTPPQHVHATIAAPPIATTTTAPPPPPVTTAAPPPPPPPPTSVGGAQVRIGQPSAVTGDVDAKALRATLASAYVQYNACYARALRAGAKPQAYTADMHVKLGSSSSAQMAVPDFLTDAGQCIMSAATSALSSMAGNGTAVVPIEFVPGP